MLCMNTSVFVFMITLYATSYGGKVMFFIWICAIFGSFCGNFALFPTATSKAFGPRYVAVNYGLVFTSQVCLNSYSLVDVHLSRLAQVRQCEMYSLQKMGEA